MYDDDIISYDESLDLSGLPGRPWRRLSV
jgi:hypothetical protein